MIGVLLVIVLMVRSTMAASHRPKEVYSVYFRIFTSYLQLVSLTASFNLNWPGEVKALLSGQEEAGSVTK